MATACSSDMSRFSADNPFSNPFRSAATRDVQSTASLAKGTAKGQVSQASRTTQVSSQPLPPPMSPVASAPARVETQADRGMVTGSLGASRSAVQAPVAGTTSRVSAAGRFSDWSTNGGTPVVMAHGESVDTLAGRYGVPAGAILAANGLSSANQVTPGTKLTIPAFNPGGQANMPAPVTNKVASASQTINDASSSRAQVTGSLQKASPPAPVQTTRSPVQPAEERIKTAMARPLSEDDAMKPIRPPAPVAAKPADSAKAKADEAAAKAAADKARKEAEAKARAEAILRQRADQAERDQKRKAEAKAKSDGKAKQTAEEKAKADARNAEIAKARAEADRARKEAALAKAEADKAKKEAQAAARKATEQKAAEAKAAKSEPSRTVAVAKSEPAREEASEPPKADFRWPARGRVINGFSGRGGNEGINIAVPEGTPIKAAEGGTVAYAGSELKGYGNLVLIRHDNGYVSAYAHNSEIAVKKGDKVGRGQTIAKSGQTGNVSSPQVHFELRKGSSPVDPTPYLN